MLRVEKYLTSGCCRQASAPASELWWLCVFTESPLLRILKQTTKISLYLLDYVPAAIYSSNGVHTASI